MPALHNRLGELDEHATLVQFSDDLLERLDRFREREGRSRSGVIREAVEHYLAADREAEVDRAGLHT